MKPEADSAAGYSSVTFSGVSSGMLIQASEYYISLAKCTLYKKHFGFPRGLKFYV